MVMDFLRNNSQALTQAGLGLVSGRTPEEQLSMGVQGFTQGRQQNKTLEFLKTNAPPEILQAVQAGVLSPAEAYGEVLKSRTKRAPLQVNGRLVDPETYEVLADFSSGGTNQPKFGLNPQTAVDAQGNPVLVQLSDTGQAAQVQMPEGLSLSSKPIQLDAGTHFVLLDPITRQPIGQIAKDIAGAEQQKVQGKAEGEKISTAASSLRRANETVRQIDELLANPGLNQVVGALDQYRPSWMMGDSGRDALARLQQLQGGAFLEAFEMLKGGGQITEVEGIKAEQAIARMQRAQGEEEFKRALLDFRAAVVAGTSKLQQYVTPDAVGGGIAAPPTPQRRRFNPATGMLE